MLPQERPATIPAIAKGPFGGVREFFEMVPGPVALWSGDRSLCLLNDAAKRLTHYSENDFVHSPSLWMERIHAGDRQGFGRFVEELRRSPSRLRCDYRFFPRDADEPVWLREHALRTQDPMANGWEIMSAYTDISDLKSRHDEAAKKDDDGSAKLLNHKFQNCIHKMSMELELAQRDLRRRSNSTEVENVMECLRQALADLSDQVLKILQGRVSQDPVAILDGVVHKMRKELTRRRVNISLVRQEPLPLVEGDRDQLRCAFERVVEFCGSRLKKGGNLEIEVRRKESGGQVYAEVTVTSSSSAFPELAGKQELAQIEGHRIEVGMALATEILQRYRGQVSFHKVSDTQDQVTVLISASQV
jgi:hypothetical protein